MFGFVVFSRFSRLPLASRHDWFIRWSALVVIGQFIFQIWCLVVFGLTALDERVFYLQNLTDCASFDTCNIP